MPNPPRVYEPFIDENGKLNFSSNAEPKELRAWGVSIRKQHPGAPAAMQALILVGDTQYIKSPSSRAKRWALAKEAAEAAVSWLHEPRTDVCAIIQAIHDRVQQEFDIGVCACMDEYHKRFMGLMAKTTSLKRQVEISQRASLDCADFIDSTLSKATLKRHDELASYWSDQNHLVWTSYRESD